MKPNAVVHWEDQGGANGPYGRAEEDEHNETAKCNWEEQKQPIVLAQANGGQQNAAHQGGIIASGAIQHDCTIGFPTGFQMGGGAQVDPAAPNQDNGGWGDGQGADPNAQQQQQTDWNNEQEQQTDWNGQQQQQTDWNGQQQEQPAASGDWNQQQGGDGGNWAQDQQQAGNGDWNQDQQTAPAADGAWGGDQQQGDATTWGDQQAQDQGDAANTWAQQQQDDGNDANGWVQQQQNDNVAATWGTDQPDSGDAQQQDGNTGWDAQAAASWDSPADANNNNNGWGDGTQQGAAAAWGNNDGAAQGGPGGAVLTSASGLLSPFKTHDQPNMFFSFDVFKDMIYTFSLMTFALILFIGIIVGKCL